MQIASNGNQSPSVMMQMQMAFSQVAVDDQMIDFSEEAAIVQAQMRQRDQ